MKPLCWPAPVVLVGLLFAGCLHGGDKVGPAHPVSSRMPGVATPASVAASQPPPAGAPDVRAAVERALPFLEKDAAWWLDGGDDVPGGGGCVTCHHVAFGLWSHREAERAGLSIARERVEALESRAVGYYAGRSKGDVAARSQLLLARAMGPGKDDAGKRWQETQDKLVEEQEKEGYWRAAGQFPSQHRPEAESDAVVTMWVLEALGTFQDLTAPVRASRDRAWAWVQKQRPGVSNEWLLGRLLVERQLGSARAADGFRDKVLASQQADGGWKWLADPKANPSDALSTGQAVYALRLAGLPAEHVAIRKGVGYLLRTQAPDGAWIVPSRLISRKGEGKGEIKIEYIYKYWGTAWATIALARTLIPNGGLATHAPR